MKFSSKELLKHKRMDDLEKFISDNRADFDDKSPPARVWDAVEGEMQPKAKRVTFWRGFKVAAAVLLLLTTGAAMGIAFMNHQNASALASNSLTEEFLEVERYYQKEINVKVKKLASMKDYDSSVNEDLDQLDISINELKSEIADAPKGSEAEIISTMINNYKTKVELLERILDRMENNNRTTDDKNIQNESTNI